MRSFAVELLPEAIESFLARVFMPDGLVVSFLRVRCMRSWRPFCRGRPRLMCSMAMPPPDGELARALPAWERRRSALALARLFTLKMRAYRSVAQLVRAPVSKTGGWGFEVPPLLPIKSTS